MDRYYRAVETSILLWVWQQEHAFRVEDETHEVAWDPEAEYLFGYPSY